MLFAHKHAVIQALLLAICGSVMAVVLLGSDSRGRWLTTTGLLLDILGLVQLEVSGVMRGMRDFILEADEKGENLPSRVVREVIDNPDASPMAALMRQKLLFDPAASLQLIALGCVVQLVGVWF